MRKNWMRLGLLPLFAAALVVAGCADRTGPAERLIGPDAAAALAKGGQGKGKALGKQKEKGPKVKGKKRNGAGWTFEAAVGTLSVGDTLVARKVIGPEGGHLTAAGHVLVVPRGAVEQITLFKMRQVRQATTDGSTLISVKLKASSDLDDDETLEEFEDEDSGNDVGAAGFKVPVQLYFTYRWSTNVDDSNADRATIVWLKSSTDAEEVPHPVYRDKAHKYVYTLLDHFSSYLLAMP